MTKKKIISFIALGAVLILLIAAYVIVQVTRPKPEEKKPPELLPKEKLGENDPGEELDAGVRILIFPRRDRTKIAKISVHNEHGDYTMIKGAGDAFSVEGFDGAYLDDQKTAALVVTAGYAVTSQRLVDEATDEELEKYGLAEPSAYWVVTDTSGKEYRVNVGDRMISGDGYYCAYEGRRAVYVLSRTLETSVLMPVEYYVTPLLVLGLTNENYSQVEEFTILHGEDDIFVSVAKCSDDEMMNPDAVMEAKLIYPAGYKANDSFYVDVIGSLVSMTGTDTVAIAPTEEQYEQYGLKDPPFHVHFSLMGYDFNLFFSDVMEDGYRYGISYLYNYSLIARFNAEDLAWLDSDLFKWAAAYPLSINITTVNAMRVVTEDRDVTFSLTHGTDGDGRATLDVASDAGVSFPNSDIYNFRQFYKSVIAAKIKGTSSLTDEEKKEITSDEKNAIVHVIFSLKDGRTFDYGFYRATTREALMTVNGEGVFYINSDNPEKVAADLERLLNGIEIDAYGKD